MKSRSRSFLRMEVPPRVNSVVAKRLWNVLKLSFFMIRKGLISNKRKLLRDMSLLMNKRGRLVPRSLSTLLSHHHRRHGRDLSRGSFILQEYEFSCSNSPNPVFSHLHRRGYSHHLHHHISSYIHFPCMDPPKVADDETDSGGVHSTALVPRTPEFGGFELDGTAVIRSPLLLSPVNFMVPDDSTSEEDEQNDSGNGGEVDAEAEEFIRRFYEQLRAQSRIQLLQYQEMEYQQMLARGA